MSSARSRDLRVSDAGPRRLHRPVQLGHAAGPVLLHRSRTPASGTRTSRSTTASPGFRSTIRRTRPRDRARTTSTTSRPRTASTSSPSTSSRRRASASASTRRSRRSCTRERQLLREGPVQQPHAPPTRRRPSRSSSDRKRATASAASRRHRIDVDNPYNPFGFTLNLSTDTTTGGTDYFIGRRPLEGGPRVFEQDVNTWYVGGGFRGDFAARPNATSSGT